MTTTPVELRELLERVAKPVLFKSQENDHADACAELRALLAEQPQAGAGYDPVEVGELHVRLESGHKQFEFEEYSSAYALQDGTHYLYAVPQPAARHDQGDEVRRLREALSDAAQSLETISNLAGRDEHMANFIETRSYASSRAQVARAALTQSPKGEEA